MSVAPSGGNGGGGLGDFLRKRKFANAATETTTHSDETNMAPVEASPFMQNASDTAQTQQGGIAAFLRSRTAGADMEPTYQADDDATKTSSRMPSTVAAAWTTCVRRS